MKKKIILLGFIVLFTLSAQAGSGLIIKGTLQNRDGDTVIATAWPHSFVTNTMNFLPKQEETAIIRDGHFSIRISGMDEPFYFRLTIKKMRLQTTVLPFFIAEPGDTLNLDIQENRIAFTGNRINKYLYQYEAAQAYPEIARKYAVFRVLDSSNFTGYVRESGLKRVQMLQEQLDHLTKWKEKLSPDLYEAFEADLIGNAGNIICNSIRERIIKSGMARYFKDLANVKESQQQLYQFIDSLLAIRVFAERPQNQSIVPKNWLSFQLARYSFCPDSCSRASVTKKILELRVPYYTQLQTLYLIERYPYISDPVIAISQALSFMKDNNCRYILDDLKLMLSGKPAYDFALLDTYKKVKRLHEFTNKVVVMDFWFTGCSGCVSFYHKLMKPLEKVFTDTSQVVFITVSIDKLFETWTGSIPTDTYTSGHVTNLYTGGKGLEHPIIDSYRINAYPTGILITRKGYIHKILKQGNDVGEIAGIINQLTRQ